MGAMNLAERVQRAAGRRVEADSLAVVRIAFGAVVTLSALRLLRNGWVQSLFVDPEVHLRYSAMSWVPVLPGWAVHLQVLVVAGAAIAVMLGWRYRWSMAVLVVAFSWLEFTEASVYLNHYWFITIAGALMWVLPMAATWSLDARRSGAGPPTVPVGAVWLMRAQVAVVYLGAGVAKLHGDWLVRAQPLAMWLPARSDLPVIGDALAPLLGSPNAALVMSWSGAAFDCLVVGFLLWRRTRLAAWLVVICFHVVTWVLFPVIGVFPWLMIAMSTVFFDPDWPQRMLNQLMPNQRSALRSGRHGGESVGQNAGVAELAGVAGGQGRSVPRWAVVAAGIWLVLQVALPLRHFAYPGDHRWTGEAYRFGWNVMLVEKAGDVTFRITDPSTGRTQRSDASDLLTPMQLRVMRVEPELIRQTAHALARRHGPGTEVRVDAFVSLNGRPPARIIDPEVDLAAEPWSAFAQPWILPLT